LNWFKIGKCLHYYNISNDKWVCWVYWLKAWM